MKEKDLPIDRTRHAVYTKKAKKCVLRLLHRNYDDQTCQQLWEKIQLQYCEFLKDEPPMAGAKIKVSIYDPILIFAWYKVVPDKPTLEEVQQDVFRCFMGSFDALGKVFNLNRRLDNRLASRIFQKANDIRVQEIRRFPGSFRMGSCSYDRENGVIRYSFTQCPNAEFAKRHHMEDVLPVMCNCDHIAMQKLHASLIREGTCVESPCCDYCIVGDRHPLAQGYELVRKENGLLISVKKQVGRIREEEGWRRFPDEAYRVLRPGGEMYINDLTRKGVHLTDALFHWEHAEEPLFTMKEFEQQALRSGFAAVKRCNYAGLDFCFKFQK